VRRSRGWLALVAAGASAILSPSVAGAQAARTTYLQSPTERSIDVVWRTTTATPTRVCFGPAGGPLTLSAGSGAATLDHAVRLDGLLPDTAYAYAVGQAACPSPAAPGDRFRTAPARGTGAPFRLWVLGDSGTGGAGQRQVRDAMLGASADRAPDLFLHLGDMAYNTGTVAEFDTRFFEVYADILRHTPVWPTLGNHEGTSSNSSTQTGPYYDAYVLPSDGRAGGLTSGTEAYYAFDWGPVHFVVLDSHESPRTTAGAMLRWLDADLAATDQRWIVAFFHHPPYTHGTHDSDLESQLIEMRQNALPILEAHGVDLVLGGHSHIYERSFLVQGAYDTPTTAAGHIVDPGDGRLDGDGAYHSGAEGALYVVAGHGGASLGGAADHPLMAVSEVAYGSCIVDVEGDSLTLRNVRADGVESDHVTLVKGVVAPMESVIPFGAGWQYSDRGEDRGDGWRRGEGAAWPEGPAQLGYGDGDEATVLLDADPNVPTVYFRRSFTLDAEVDRARLRAVFDDGIAVWINGTEVARANVNSLDFSAWATTGMAAEQRLDQTLDLSGINPFVRGENWIAAVVKQANATSSDVSFDLSLAVGLRPVVGPGDGGVSELDAGQPSTDAGIAVDARIAADTGIADDAGGGSGSGGCGCRAARGRAPAAGWAALALGAGLVARRRRRR